jgi:hypothetical protein
VKGSVNSIVLFSNFGAASRTDAPKYRDRAESEFGVPIIIQVLDQRQKTSSTAQGHDDFWLRPDGQSDEYQLSGERGCVVDEQRVGFGHADSLCV